MEKLTQELLLSNTLKQHIQKDKSHGRQFANSYSKIKKKDTCVGLNEEKSSDKRNNEECKQPTAESNFEER